MRWWWWRWRDGVLQHFSVRHRRWVPDTLIPDFGPRGDLPRAVSVSVVLRSVVLVPRSARFSDRVVLVVLVLAKLS